MKKIKLLILLLSFFTIINLIESCKKDSNCPTGYTGASCEQIDTTQIQALLENGTTPMALFNNGVILEQLYGKLYEGGIIFYLDTNSGTGMVAATEDQGYGTWGCYGVIISGSDGGGVGDGAQNTMDILGSCNEIGIAAKICDDLLLNGKSDWFLPSKDELNLMYTNLHLKGHGGFQMKPYWSSSEYADYNAWANWFNDGFQIEMPKYLINYVRAARAF